MTQHGGKSGRGLIFLLRQVRISFIYKLTNKKNRRVAVFRFLFSVVAFDKLFLFYAKRYIFYGVRERIINHP